MKSSNLRRAFEKAGLSVVGGINSSKYSVKAERYHATWYDQEGEACCVCVTRNGEFSDAQTDYFPGFYANTIKQAVAWTLGG